MSEIVVCKGLRKSYNKNPVLTDVSFSLKPGKLAGLAGENGSGKSTLVRCLLGFTSLDAGSVQLPKSIGYCPQNKFLNENFTVREHLRFLGSILKKKYSINRKYVENIISLLKVEPYMDQLIRNVSHGTYQKIKLLSAVYHQPEFIVLDEPYEGFDWQMYLVFWDVVEELIKNGSVILMISHLIYDQDKFDLIYKLENGVLNRQ